MNKPRINLKKLDIHSISNSSGAFYGDNKQNRFEASSIKNDGLGEVNGDQNTIHNNKSSVTKLKNN